MKVLVLGASGMLGSAAFRGLAAEPSLDVYATARAGTVRHHFAKELQDRLFTQVDVSDMDSVLEVLGKLQPDVVLNCVGVVKQLATANDPLVALPLNALLPHRLARATAVARARLVHISTDCVFQGTRGAYTEAMVPDATDLYGRSKLLGEVDYPHAITLRTSIIGRELGTRNGLVEWFLGEDKPVRGFTRAIFSGLPTDELVRVIVRHVLPRPDLHGVWHVGAAPINKHDLITLVRDAYGKRTDIVPDDSLVIDRSLDSTRFRRATGYEPPDWPTLISVMRSAEMLQ